MTRGWVAGPDEAPVVTQLIVEFRDHLGGSEPSAESALESVGGSSRSPTPSSCWRRRARGRRRGCSSCASAGACGRARRTRGWRTCSSALTPAASGLGDALVRLAFERALARGARRIELDCFEDNAPALALYERNGFSVRSKGSSRTLLLGRPL